MDIEKEREKISLFTKIGIVVLSSLLIISGLYHFISDAVSVSNSSTGRELPIYCVNRTDNLISISFDAAWGNEDTNQILDILKKNQVRATFFMTGEWIEHYPEDVKAIAAAGHDLANHSENHKHMTQISEEKCETEIMKAHNKVKELTGQEMNLFRPPYGDYNNMVIQVSRRCGYYPIQWSIDSLDWKDYGVERLINTVVEHKKLDKGAIILCHNGATYTKDALEQIIVKLKEKGYAFVPISELIYTGNYYIDTTGKQFVK